MTALVVALCLAFVACSPGEGREPRAAPATTAAPAPDPACPNQEAVVADDSLRTGNPESGDVDGDGEEETVSVYFDPEGELGCEAFVAASSGDRTIAGALDTWRGEYGLPMPTLNVLADLDGEPGDEIVVNMGAGASTQFVGIVIADGPVLRQVTTDVPGQAAPGMFGTGGSVGHIEAVDCAPGGGVIVSIALPEDDVYRVHRTWFDFAGAKLIQEDEEVRRVRVDEIDRFPEYPASPFGSCS